jgi:hypothetical protein
MTIKWCPNCRREIKEPSLSVLSSLAKFSRNVCYICDCPLRMAEQSSQSANPTGAATASSPPAEPQSTPAPEPEPRAIYDNARKAEADRLRFEYETRKAEVDRLRFEYEKRQREVQILQANLVTANRAYDNLEEMMSHGFHNDENSDRCREAMSSTMERIFDLHNNISRAEREMQEIQQSLDCPGQ